MDIVTVVEGINHVFVVCNMSKNTKLNLRIVGINEHTAVFCLKEFSHLSAKLGTNGNILKIGLGRRNSARSGFCLIEV